MHSHCMDHHNEGSARWQASEEWAERVIANHRNASHAIIESFDMGPNGERFRLITRKKLGEHFGLTQCRCGRIVTPELGTCSACYAQDEKEAFHEGYRGRL